MKWYIKVLKQYIDFNGRARRTEFWMYTLFQFLILFFMGFILGDLSSIINFPELEYLVLFYLIGILPPTFAVIVRRLHDLGKSGWMLLVLFVPFIGNIWFIVLMATNGQSGSNRYGKDPKNPFDEIDEIGNN